MGSQTPKEEEQASSTNYAEKQTCSLEHSMPAAKPSQMALVSGGKCTHASVAGGRTPPPRDTSQSDGPLDHFAEHAGPILHPKD